MTQYCPACGESVVGSLGDTSNDYLIIEEFPDVVLTPKPALNKWQRDDWTPRKILSNELEKVSMVFQQFRVVPVFPHYAPNNGMPDENCYNSGLGRAIAEINGKKGVIILGSNLCKYFTEYDLKQVQGLSGVDSQYIPDNDVPRVFLPSIRSIYSTGAGEVRVGLERFVDLLRR